MAGGMVDPNAPDNGQRSGMIDKLELFLALARERHFGRAAEACNISQPTLSSAIKQLEEQLGVQLVRRGARFQGLTAEGERTLEWARRIIGDTRTLQAEMRAAKAGLSGNATIAAIPTALAMVHELTTALSARYPDVTYTILSRTSAQILEMVGNLEADIGITYLDNEPLGAVLSIPIYRESYLFVTARESPPAARSTITWKEAAQATLCLLTPDMQNRRIVDGYISQSGATARPIIETDSVIVMVSHVMNGRCSGILPGKTAGMFEGFERIRLIPLTDPVGSHVVGAVAARNDPHTPLVDALLRQCREMAVD